jgi:hypothetical protein
MQKINLFQKAPMNLFVAAFVSAGFALVASCLFAVVACYLGILFSGLDTVFAVIVATGCCVIVGLLTAVACKRYAKQFTWPSLFCEVMLLALVVVGLMSWFQTRDKLKLFLDPVPSSLHVHHGRSDLFGCYIHFSAPSAIIAAIIQSKQLAPPANDSEQIEEDRMKISRNWWQPDTMSNPRFFMRHHTSDAVQGWTDGLWVNGVTNEVYAFITG